MGRVRYKWVWVWVRGVPVPELTPYLYPSNSFKRREDDGDPSSYPNVSPPISQAGLNLRVQAQNSIHIF